MPALAWPARFGLSLLLPQDSKTQATLERASRCDQDQDKSRNRNSNNRRNTSERNANQGAAQKTQKYELLTRRRLGRNTEIRTQQQRNAAHSTRSNLDKLLYHLRLLESIAIRLAHRNRGSKTRHHCPKLSLLVWPAIHLSPFVDRPACSSLTLTYTTTQTTTVCLPRPPPSCLKSPGDLRCTESSIQDL
ncbi:hypothetical protein CGCF413_v013051 [Colletotrichum fructicola]|nr:hypothetical protein CGCF413_v013051 [Colletotrichum fructicola]